MRYVFGALVAAFALTGCAEAMPRAPRADGVPNVVGRNLDEAEEILDERGVAYAIETPGGDSPLIEHLWWVCSQEPIAGARADFVTLYAEHTCD